MGWVSGLIGQRTFRAWGLAAVLVVTMAAIAGGIAFGTTTGTNPCNNPATLEGSAFEIDTNANLIVNQTNCIDWLSGGSGTGFRSGVLAKNDKPTGAGDDSFGKGTAENDANPTIVDGSIPPNKSDLKAFGVFPESGQATTDNPTGKNLALFWSRVQNPSGTTNMDFELNQKFCNPAATPTNCANNSHQPPETPIRTVGDKLITYDLSKGGTVPTISIRTWNGSAWGTATVISGGAGGALGSVNTSTIPANQTGGVSGGLTTALGQQDPFTFGEATISFGALFGPGACGTFGSAYLKSRSSDSFTAEIKDFVAPEKVNISNCPAGLTTTATTPVTIGEPISDTAHLDTGGTNPQGTITFHLYSDAGCNNEINTGLSPVTVNGDGDYNSGNYTPTAIGSYYWTATYSGDATHDPASTACGDPGETSEVNPAESTLSTAQSFYPNDEATVSSGAGGTPTGNVTFALFDNATCSGNPIYGPVSDDLNGSGVASTSNTTFAISSSTTVYWKVDYPGDAKHTEAHSCTENTQLTINN